ncbi:MAG TPA: DUF721 domain-containing protein [Bacteroidales bacterium]|nr:DUF721 domain-containing protein [Bacteroidales bacterium]
MRRSKTVTIGEVIREILKERNMTQKRREISIERYWNQLVGPLIVSYTDSMFVRNRVLYVKLKSAPLKNELMYKRQMLVDSLNKEVGDKVIDKIAFL